MKFTNNIITSVPKTNNILITNFSADTHFERVSFWRGFNKGGSLFLAVAMAMSSILDIYP